MGKIPASQAASMFEEILGWPYASPGSNDARGIDCSGAWVRVFKKFGRPIYHGSNTQYREYCSTKGAITANTQLRVGMAVFKNRADGQEPARFQGDGIDNMYHVGCVTSVNPVRVVHATSPVAKTDAGAKAWTHWGMFSDVDFGESGSVATPPGAPSTAPSVAPGIGQATVRGGTLLLRKAPSKGAAVIKGMPDGAVIEVLERVDGWVRVRYVDPADTPHAGYCDASFLTFGTAPAKRWYVLIPCATEAEALARARLEPGAQVRGDLP
jgi:cell wall-associated NlpC family hydrolase